MLSCAKSVILKAFLFKFIFLSCHCFLFKLVITIPFLSFFSNENKLFVKPDNIDNLFWTLCSEGFTDSSYFPWRCFSSTNIRIREYFNHIHVNYHSEFQEDIIMEIDIKGIDEYWLIYW